MTDTEKLMQGLETLRETIQRDWANLDSKQLEKDQRAEIRSSIEQATSDLKSLDTRLWAMDEGGPA